MKSIYQLFIISLLLCNGFIPAVDNYQQFKIENVPILLTTNQQSRNTIIYLFITGGKAAEPLEKAGLSYLTSRLAIEITEDSVVRQLMDYGSRFFVEVYPDFSLIYIHCLSDYYAPTMKIFFDVFTDPLFSGLRIDGIKDMMTANRKRLDDMPEQIMRHNHLQTQFKLHPYGHPLYGTAESLKKIKTKDIKKYYADYFHQDNLHISIASDLPKEEISRVLALPIKKIRKGQPSSLLKTEKPVLQPPESLSFDKETTQTLISKSIVLPEISAVNYIQALLYKNLLGKWIGARLWPLRSKHQLVYSSHAALDYFFYGGIVLIYLKTSSAHIQSAQKELDAILADIQQNGCSEEEFKQAQSITIVDFYEEMERKNNQAFFAGFNQQMGLDNQLLSDFSSVVKKIKHDDFQQFIRQCSNPAGMTQVIIGPKPIPLPEKSVIE